MIKLKNIINKKIIIYLCLVVIMCILVYKLFMYVVIKYGGTNLQTRMYNGIVTEHTDINIDSELSFALQWNYNWDNLFLTNNFKEKFKNRKGIVEDIDNYVNIGPCSYFEEGKSNVCKIMGDRKKSIIEMINQNTDSITTNFYFEYEIDENGWLDDVRLIKRQDTDRMTGEIIK